VFKSLFHLPFHSITAPHLQSKVRPQSAAYRAIFFCIIAAVLRHRSSFMSLLRFYVIAAISRHRCGIYILHKGKSPTKSAPDNYLSKDTGDQNLSNW
jgi:hypothetical protein